MRAAQYAFRAAHLVEAAALMAGTCAWMQGPAKMGRAVAHCASSQGRAESVRAAWCRLGAARVRVQEAAQCLCVVVVRRPVVQAGVCGWAARMPMVVEVW